MHCFWYQNVVNDYERKIQLDKVQNTEKKYFERKKKKCYPRLLRKNSVDSRNEA